MFIDEPITGFPEGISVADYVLERVDEFSTKSAVVDSDTGIDQTYAEIFRAIEQDEARLRSFGMGLGDVLAVVSRDLSACACLTLAAARVGASFWLGFDWLFRDSEKRRGTVPDISEHIRPTLVVVDDDLVTEVKEALGVRAENGAVALPYVITRTLWGEARSGSGDVGSVNQTSTDTKERSVARVILPERPPSHWPVEVRNDELVAGIARVRSVLKINQASVGLLTSGARIEQYRLLLLLFSIWASGATAVVVTNPGIDRLLQVIERSSITWLCAGEVGPLWPSRLVKLDKLPLDKFDLSSLETMYVVDRYHNRVEVEDAFECEVIDGAWPTYSPAKDRVQHKPRWEMERDLSPARYRQWRESQRGFIRLPLAAHIDVDAITFQKLLAQVFNSHPALATEVRKTDAWQKVVQLELVGELAGDSKAFAVGLLAAAKEIGFEHTHLRRIQEFIDDYELVADDLDRIEDTDRILLEVASDSFEFCPHDFWQLITWASRRGQFEGTVADILASRRLTVGYRYETDLQHSAQFLLRRSIAVTDHGLRELERLHELLRAHQASPEYTAIRDKFVAPFYRKAGGREFLGWDAEERAVWLSEFARTSKDLDEPTAHRLLDSQNWRGRRVAAWMVGYRDWKHFSPLLVDRLKNPSTHTRGALAVGIAMLAVPSAAVGLRDLLEEGDPDTPGWLFAAAALQELDRAHGTTHADRYLAADGVLEEWQARFRERYRPEINVPGLPEIGKIVTLLRDARNSDE